MKLIATLFLTAIAHGAELPKGTALLADTTSPDGRHGIVEHTGDDAQRNQLIELKTGRIVLELAGAPGFSKMNHGGVRADWSPDSRRVLWMVEGKWGPLAMTFAELDAKGGAAQLDVLKAAHTELLARTRKMFPKVYAAAVAENKGNGSAYPDGFTVDALAPSEMKPPMRFTFALTSNPKGIVGFPEAAQLDAFIEGTLLPGRKIEWRNFQAWDAAAARRENDRGNFVCEEIEQVTFRAGEKLTGAAKQKLEAECEAWTEKHKEQFGDGTDLEAISPLELNRRIRVAMEARIRELKKRK